MAAKRKDHGNHLTTKMKKGKTENRDFSDDEDLSDIDDDVEIFNGIRIPAAMPAVVSAEDNPGPRMVIKLIVANNFKSYYGTVTIGPFHQVSISTYKHCGILVSKRSERHRYQLIL